jgi:phytoene/squalene synthetase
MNTLHVRMQVKTVAEYDKYCHYVVGLPTVAFTPLFGELYLTHARAQLW